MFRRGSSSRIANTNDNQELDLKLNLSQPRRGGRGDQGPQGRASRARTSPETSPPRSCVSSDDNMKYSSSPETTSMVLVGCPRCLMYVMLPQLEPKCPKCKSTVLLDFQHQTVSLVNGANDGPHGRVTND